GVERGRKRCPADVASARTPAHPRRSPHRAWKPSPPELSMMPPTAIVESRPAPWVGALERPAVVRIEPLAIRCIRNEIESDGIGIRHPSAHAVDDHPFSIRAHRGVELLVERRTRRRERAYLLRLLLLRLLWRCLLRRHLSHLGPLGGLWRNVTLFGSL